MQRGLPGALQLLQRIKIMTTKTSHVDSAGASIRNALRLTLRTTLLAAALSIGTQTFVTSAYAAGDEPVSYSVQLPLIPGWYKGQQIFYLQTEASDQAVAMSQQATYVKRLANAATASPSAVDDIYAVTNFKQSNIVPSAPLPEGPTNADPDYTPLWQVTLVTWANPKHAHLLTSEEDVKTAAAAGEVTLSQTPIVVNCPIIYSATPVLPGATPWNIDRISRALFN
jgi:hypothetical protein